MEEKKTMPHTNESGTQRHRGLSRRGKIIAIIVGVLILLIVAFLLVTANAARHRMDHAPRSQAIMKTVAFTPIMSSGNLDMLRLDNEPLFSH
jgi:hypothetical protein